MDVINNHYFFLMVMHSLSVPKASAFLKPTKRKHKKDEKKKE